LDVGSWLAQPPADEWTEGLTVMKPAAFRFGSYEISPRAGEIRKHGVLIRLAPQPFQVLLTLVEHAGQLVNREELQQRLWGNDQTTVEFDAGLNRCIRQIRAALADNAEAPRYIETEPRKGYRFIASVQTVAIDSGAKIVPTKIAPAKTPLPDASTSDDQPNFLDDSVASGTVQTAGVSQLVGFRPPKQGLIAFAIAVTGLVVIAFYFVNSRRPDLPASMDIIPLASALGEHYSPAFSPDGRRVVFTWNGERRDNFDVYVKTLGESSAVRLTTNPNVDYSPAWSPDGRWIAFCRGSAKRGGSILLLPAQGGPERKVADLDSIAVPMNPVLSWLRDSKQLVVAQRLAGFSQDGLTLVDVETGERKLLAAAGPGEEHMDPAVSPDGRTVAFTKDTGRGVSAIYLLSLADGQAQILPSLFSNREFHNVYNAQPVWTPDGGHIVFSSNVYGGHHLWITSVDSVGAPKVLSALGGDLDGSAISTKGQLVAGHTSSDRNIWKVELSTLRQSVPVSTLVIGSTRDESNPSVSPDGSRIAFASDRGGYAEIWTSLADGSKAVPLTSLRNPVTGSPTWSPDGHRIAFDSRAGGRPQIYVVSSSGGPAEKLDCGAGSNVLPHWSPDGKWIYYSTDRSGRMEIWRIAPSGIGAEPVTKSGGFGAKLSADGTLLYFTSDNASMSSLWQLNLQTEEHKLISESVDRRAYAPTRDGVYYFIGSEIGENSLFFYSRKTPNKKTLVLSTAKRIDAGVSLTPDGQSLYYAQLDQNNHELLLVNNFWSR
jgi:Tol biopolymer transport system component/DNA-binding winged helix-turn-helix (wHTH) protein